MFGLVRAVVALGKGNKVVDDDPRRAVPHYVKGLAAARSSPSVQFLLRLALVEAYRATGELDDAIAILRDIEDTAQKYERHPSGWQRSYRFGVQGVTAADARLGALEELAEMYGEAKQPDSQVAALQRLADAAGTSDLHLRAQALRKVAEVEHTLGRTEQSKASIRLALDEAVARNDILGHAEALHREACFLWDDGDGAAARDRLMTASELFNRAADLDGQARVEGQLGVFAWREDDLLTARTHLNESLELARAAGSETTAEVTLGWLDRVGKRLASNGTDSS